jgi:hypothetical protein
MKDIVVEKYILTSLNVKFRHQFYNYNFKILFVRVLRALSKKQMTGLFGRLEPSKDTFQKFKVWLSKGATFDWVLWSSFNHRPGIEVDRACFYKEFFPLFKLKLSAAYEIRLWSQILMCAPVLGLMHNQFC